jgi:hypothetical protein
MYTRSKRAIRALLRKTFPPTTEQIFTEIFQTNSWLGKSSVSGSGSDPDQTANITAEIPKLFRRFNISTVLDIPCGDFHWMRRVDLSEIKYLGADIVKELVALNYAKFHAENISFSYANMITDRLPQVDLILCRDGLVHLSYADIGRALKNFSDSGSTYLLTTTFPARKTNEDIRTGLWRPLNLQISPFNFPSPLLTILEGCTENDGIFHDKSLALWKLSDLTDDRDETSTAEVLR